MAGFDITGRLTKDNLQSADAVLGVGLVAVKELYERGIVVLFLNETGQLEICPAGEMELDGLAQEDALAVLLDKGYTDEQLMAYMKGRKAREAHNG